MIDFVRVLFVEMTMCVSSVWSLGFVFTTEFSKLIYVCICVLVSEPIDAIQEARGTSILCA